MHQPPPNKRVVSRTVKLERIGHSKGTDLSIRPKDIKDHDANSKRKNLEPIPEVLGIAGNPQKLKITNACANTDTKWMSVNHTR